MNPVTTATVIVLLSAALAGCATMNARSVDQLDHANGAPRIVMMPPNVELSEVATGGQAEVNALWTKAARENLAVALRESLRARGANFVEFKEPPEDDSRFDRFDQLVKLHGVVAEYAWLYGVSPAPPLPGKGKNLDWGLGPATAELGQWANADYALMVWVRDSYTSAGRVAMQVMAAALFGVGLQGGIQHGYASLIDLKTGQIVWINRLYRDSGDLRTLEPSRESVTMLLTEMPK